MINHFFQNHEELILDDINEETSIDIWIALLKKKLKLF